ncbi:hypothetical protein GXM_06513 [Nostoc sphaeroides CCNUC1]|uniref:Uncharacterized protein n=1 Tax=Nostoc sphaeroides CCNUC1 TaxID=2653204 RepID=A0A5P8WAT6_9NOSO|nr:hypothetical protein GXM_06513 [Nostoc sphaeroides CCNUC1]
MTTAGIASLIRVCFSENGRYWWVKSAVQAIAIISPKTPPGTLIISSTSSGS